MKPTYEHDEAKRLRLIYNQLLSYKYDFIDRVSIEKLSQEQRVAANVEAAKLSGELTRLDWFINHLVFGWEKQEEGDNLTIVEVAGEPYKAQIEKYRYEIEKLKTAVRRLYRTKTPEEGLTMENRIKRSEIIKELNIS